MKKWSKKLYFSKLILTKIILKKLGTSLKKQKEKKKCKQQNLPKKILVGKKSITDTESIAESFNKYFTRIGPKLVKILVHQLKVLMTTLRNMTLPSQKT